MTNHSIKTTKNKQKNKKKIKRIMSRALKESNCVDQNNNSLNKSTQTYSIISKYKEIMNNSALEHFLN